MYFSKRCVAAVGLLGFGAVHAQDHCGQREDPVPDVCFDEDFLSQGDFGGLGELNNNVGTTNTGTVTTLKRRFYHNNQPPKNAGFGATAETDNGWVAVILETQDKYISVDANGRVDQSKLCENTKEANPPNTSKGKDQRLFRVGKIIRALEGLLRKSCKKGLGGARIIDRDGYPGGILLVYNKNLPRPSLRQLAAEHPEYRIVSQALPVAPNSQGIRVSDPEAEMEEADAAIDELDDITDGPANDRYPNYDLYYADEGLDYPPRSDRRESFAAIRPARIHPEALPQAIEGY